jgi:hypothetical protein
MKIDNIAASPYIKGNSKRNFREFIETLMKLKVNQSFVVAELASNDRMAIKVFEIYSGANIVTRKDAKGVRVGRVK